MRRNLFPHRRDRWTPGIKCRLEHSFVQFQVALANLLLLVGQQLLKILRVHFDRVGEINEVEWQHLRIRQSQYRSSHSLRQRPSIDEVRVGEMCVPVKVVVNGVIDSLFVLAAIAQVQSGNAQVIDERREIGSRAQRIDAQISSLPQFLP